MPDPSTTYDTLAALITRLNALSSDYEIGGLQALRKEVHGFKQRPTVTPFPSKPNNADWAFHVGGRRELQFNVGYDRDDSGEPALRYGVAFSFESGHDLPDPMAVLSPLVPHFNDYVRAHDDQLDDIRIWVWRGATRSPSRPLGPIRPEEEGDGIFVFAGWLGPRVPTEADLRGILSSLDRLMPLYEAVLRVNASQVNRSTASPTAPMGGTTMVKGKTHAVVPQPARLVDVSLRHRVIQKALHDEMVKRHGPRAVRHEHPTALGGRIDLRVVEPGGRIVYYEVKTAATARGCIREAVGQLLEYAHWPGAESVHELVVVSDLPLDDEAAAWLRELDSRYGLALGYYQVELVAAGDPGQAGA